MAKSLKGLENKLEQLDKVVKELESGELGLDDSLKKFENGVGLYKDCRQLLNEAEKKIKVLTDDLQEKDLD